MDRFPARIAPQVDRLVLGINRQVGPRHGRVLEAIATELGLDSLKLIPHFADFWLHGPLHPEIAEARLPYSVPGELWGRLDRFVQFGLLDETDHGFEATARFRPLLVASVAARADVVESALADAPTTEIDPLIVRVIGAVPDAYRVAVAHRSLTPALSPLLGFFDHLVTLRYVRQHDHVGAWRDAGLTASDMRVITPLWLDQIPPDDPETSARLEARGVVENGRLSDVGRRLREHIEAETNRRASLTWSVLDADDRERLVDLLTHLAV